MTFMDRVADGGQKKLLACDGGGIRGLITLEFLAKIEDTLRAELGAGDDFVLADYFDYVAGTSTGAIIACCVSMGMSVPEIKKFYVDSGEKMFTEAGFLSRITMKNKYSKAELTATLKSVIGDKLGSAEPTLGDPNLETLLMMVMRNVTTDSPWPLSNNPHAKYNDPDADDSNLELPLWQLVRASTAAPVFFPPEEIVIGKNKFVFVDGGITMYNNPAFQLFLMATLEPYRLQWTAEEDRMLIVSVGTGAGPKVQVGVEPKDITLVKNLGGIPAALMYAALNEQDLLCRTFGRCRHGAPIDGEIGDLKAAPALGTGDSKMFTYMRYNALLTREGLDEVGLQSIEPENVSKLDSTEFMDQLMSVGSANADAQVKPEHFQGFV